jgi:hypothetical protein
MFLALIVGAPRSPSLSHKGPAIDVPCIDGGCSWISGTAFQGVCHHISFIDDGRSQIFGIAS